MREILFRGKREIDAKWIYGLYSDDYVYDTDFPCIIPLRSGNNSLDWAVIRETVGQYTGLTDKNGRRIFEGDILKFTDADGRDVYLNVVFEDGAFLMEEDGVINSDLIPSYDCLGVEVIGNIYDNPELLKGVTSDA